MNLMKHPRFKLAAIPLALVAVAVAAFAQSVNADATALGLAPLVIGNMVTPEEIKKLEEAVTKKCGEIIETCQKAIKDCTSKFGTLTGEMNEKVTEVASEGKKLAEDLKELKTRATDLEQKLAARPAANEGNENKTAGQIFIESPEFKAGVAGGEFKVGRVKIGNIADHYRKTAIINAAPPAASASQPLVVADRIGGIITPSVRRLTIRDLLPQMRTSSNLVEFATESTTTNNAAPQFSSPDSRENVLKAESAMIFTLTNAAVTTIAHFVPASRQILADAAGLQSYIDQRLLYLLKLAEEVQLLLGDGTAANINGLWTGGTNYSQGVSNDTKLDALLKAQLQVAISEYAADGYILNPVDWFAIRGLKDTQGRYLIGGPQESADPRIWGLPVVVTNSMTVGNFMCASFALGAAIWDREDANIRVSTDYSDFFARNMVAILAEERLTQTIYRATAIIRGALPALGT